jgi:hypothetical protein
MTFSLCSTSMSMQHVKKATLHLTKCAVPVARNSAKKSCPFCREALESENFVQEAKTDSQPEVAKIIRLENLNQQSVALRPPGAAAVAIAFEQQQQPQQQQQERVPGVDATQARELYDTWELIEIEHSNNQLLLERICLNALKDPRCGGLIVRAAQNNAPFLRHIASVVFRFHALVVDRRRTPEFATNGPIATSLGPEMRWALELAVENIIQPLEKKTPRFIGVEEPIPVVVEVQDVAVESWSGGDWADLANEGLRALISALRSGSPTEALKILNLRLLKAMTSLFNDLERIPEQEVRNAKRTDFKARISRFYLKAGREILKGSTLDQFLQWFQIVL